MDPATTDPQQKEARMLAAIVFTDVVGFSKLASQNEARVYVALQRDMGVMTNLCRAHGGQVLNTMGDGMLLCFTSAVDAMSCAVEIQRTLHNQSLSLPQVEVLHHRIGVHLGDVIMNGDNVFGDGVNIAARLQAMAKPDAVCFSSTVYEIIKNKMKLDARYLGPQTLKNLGEPVKVWQVPPLSEPAAAWKGDDPAPVLSQSETSGGASGFKGAVLVLASLVLLGALGFGITKLRKPPPAMVDKPKQERHNGGDMTTPPGTTGEAGAGTSSTATPGMTAQQARAQFESLRSSHQFAKIMELVRAEAAQLPEEAAKMETWSKLASLETVMTATLGQANNLSAAIDVPSLSIGASPIDAKVYMQGGNVVAQTDRDGIVTLQMSDQNYLEIAKALSTHSTAPPEMAEWIELFSKEYGLSVQ